MYEIIEHKLSMISHNFSYKSFTLFLMANLIASFSIKYVIFTTTININTSQTFCCLNVIIIFFTNSIINKSILISIINNCSLNLCKNNINFVKRMYFLRIVPQNKSIKYSNILSFGRYKILS